MDRYLVCGHVHQLRVLRKPRMTETFALNGDYIELIKLLKATNLAETGGMAKLAIQEGLVQVDGEIEYRRGRKIRAGQSVEFNNHRIKIKTA